MTTLPGNRSSVFWIHIDIHRTVGLRARHRRQALAQRDHHLLAVPPGGLPSRDGCPQDHRTGAAPDRPARRHAPSGRDRQGHPAHPKAEVRRYPMGHFGSFRPGHHPTVAADACDFLRTRLDGLAQGIPGRKQLRRRLSGQARGCIHSALSERADGRPAEHADRGIEKVIPLVRHPAGPDGACAAGLVVAESAPGPANGQTNRCTACHEPAARLNKHRLHPARRSIVAAPPHQVRSRTAHRSPQSAWPRPPRTQLPQPP